MIDDMNRDSSVDSSDTELDSSAVSGSNKDAQGVHDHTGTTNSLSSDEGSSSDRLTQEIEELEKVENRSGLQTRLYKQLKQLKEEKDKVSKRQHSISQLRAEIRKREDAERRKLGGVLIESLADNMSLEELQEAIASGKLVLQKVD